LAIRTAGALRIILLSSFVSLSLAAPVSADPVYLAVPPYTDSVALPVLPVMIGTELVIAGSDTLTRGPEYRFSSQCDYLILIHSYPDTVHVRYRTVPALASTYRRFAPVSAEAAVPSVPANIGAEPRGVEAERFDIAGSKKLSLGIGDNGGGLIEQSLYLSIRGDVGSDLKIEGTISDRGTATEAITRRTSEFDRLSLRAYGPGFESEFGDTELRRQDFQLFSMNRRISGMRAQAARSAFSGNGVLGRRRGEFRSRRFYGEDGKQGPYPLAAGNQIAVVPGTESVWLDGEKLEFGSDRDYEIDYPTGMLTFTPRRPINRESRVTVDYEIAVEAYSSLLYEVGGGVASDGWNIKALGHREWDDPNNGKTINLLESDRAVLAAAGDSASLAVRPGVDSVGAGNGTYRRDSSGGYFVYVGPGNGDFQVVFSYLGPGAGDYRARGDGTYVFSGAGQGDYGPVIALPLPAETSLLALQGSKTWNRQRVELEWSRSDHDANRLSSRDDGDNSGNAWLGRYVFGAPADPLSANAFWRHRDARFRPPGRETEVEYDRKWGRVIGAQPPGEDEYGAEFSAGKGDTRARLAASMLRSDGGGRAWRTAGNGVHIGFGRWDSRFELLRRTQPNDVKFEHGLLRWQTPLRTLPVALHFEGERRRENSGYRFGEAGVRVGSATLNGSVAYRRTDTLISVWEKQNDFYRFNGTWQTDRRSFSGVTQVNYERRVFSGVREGAQDRLLSESRWIVRGREVTARFEYRLSRTQSVSANEEFVPVDPGRGNYRLENGQYIEDPLGDYIRVVRTAAFGELSRQSEKRANIVWQPSGGTTRAEFDVTTVEGAANAGLPAIAWLLPWHTDADSPTRKVAVRSDISGGHARMRWLWRLEWHRRFDTRTTRAEDFRGGSAELTLRFRIAAAWRIETRVGGGTEDERRLFPYEFRFGRFSLAPAWQPFPAAEISLPASWQRYWLPDGTALADWQRVALRAHVNLGKGGRIVAEPSLIRVVGHDATLPLAVADGRAPGTSGEWRLEGSLDLSKALVGRLIYRGRMQPERAPIHRADLSVEATF